MDHEALDALFRSLCRDVDRRGGVWQLTLGGVHVACVTDMAADRLRLMSPIVPSDDLDRELLRVLLTANFHTTLDARYALSEGLLYALFVHPMAPLTPGQLRSALAQVVNLVRSFGSTYSSGAFVFDS